MAMVNVMAQMQMQQTDFHNRRVELEGRVLANNGSGLPPSAAAEVLATPQDDAHLSTQGNLERAKEQRLERGTEFKSAYQNLSPAHQRAIEQRLEAEVRRQQQQGLGPVDRDGWRSSVATDYAAGKLQESLDKGTPIDPSLNKVFVTGQRYIDASMHETQLTAKSWFEQMDSVSNVIKPHDMFSRAGGK